MTRREAFLLQDKIGRKAQDRIMTVFFKAGWGVRRADQGSPRDIVATDMSGNSWRIEIKNEEKNRQTGNIAIETFQGDPPRLSGLAITGADFWIHHFGEQSVVYSVGDMKQWLHRDAATHKLRRKPFGGVTDGGCGGWLVPIWILGHRPWCDFLSTRDLPNSRVFAVPKIEPEPPDNEEQEEQGKLFNADELPEELEWL